MIFILMDGLGIVEFSMSYVFKMYLWKVLEKQRSVHTFSTTVIIPFLKVNCGPYRDESQLEAKFIL